MRTAVEAETLIFPNADDAEWGAKGRLIAQKLPLMAKILARASKMKGLPPLLGPRVQRCVAAQGELQEVRDGLRGSVSSYCWGRYQAGLAVPALSGTLEVLGGEMAKAGLGRPGEPFFGNGGFSRPADYLQLDAEGAVTGALRLLRGIRRKRDAEASEPGIPAEVLARLAPQLLRVEGACEEVLVEVRKTFRLENAYLDIAARIDPAIHEHTEAARALRDEARRHGAVIYEQLFGEGTFGAAVRAVLALLGLGSAWRARRAVAAEYGLKPSLLGALGQSVVAVVPVVVIALLLRPPHPAMPAAPPPLLTTSSAVVAVASATPTPDVRIDAIFGEVVNYDSRNWKVTVDCGPGQHKETFVLKPPDNFGSNQNSARLGYRARNVSTPFSCPATVEGGTGSCVLTGANRCGIRGGVIAAETK